MIINQNTKRKIIPIASGKGGVGKSLLTANLGIALAEQGKRTTVIDLDLGGSNLHTCLGLKNRNAGIGNFLSDPKVKFEDVIVRTPYDQLRFVPGDVLVTGMGDIQPAQKKRLTDAILSLDGDYVLIDLGAGSTFNVIDFFLISNSGFLVVTNQPTAILNAFGFLKNLVFRFLQRSFSDNKDVTKYFRSILKERDPGSTPTIADIMDGLGKIHPSSGRKARRLVSMLQPHVVMNMATAPDDLQIAESLKELVKKNLDVNLECMGLIFRDDGVNESLKNLEPHIINDRSSIAAREIERIALKMVHSERFPEMPLDLDYYRDTFELTQIEAENDYRELATPLQGSDAALEMTELISMISAQKQQINELKSTVRMLTMKNQG